MRESFIIGTAGHIDHGKTALIRALTGNQGDRLKEEKERGITIDLGFTYMSLENGKLAGIIDVPGHERFLKNMLSGASSISIVLLVIAADEGIMPQTVEHFSILKLLGMKRIAAVLTKSDRVEDEMLSLRKSEVLEFLGRNGYGDSEVFAVSSITGQGIPELKGWINKAYISLDSDEYEEKPFRMHIDRVFNSKGFGTVVTGTVMDGIVGQGDTVDLLTPGDILEAKVRGIEVHGNESKAAFKGQRCAVNLARVEGSRMHRGDTLARRGLLNGSNIIDCTFQLTDTDVKPREKERVRVYLGTREILGRIHLLPEGTYPGMVQLRLEESVYVMKGDRYVVRSYSPMHLLGGGEVIDPSARKFKASKAIEHMDHLGKAASGDNYLAFLSTLESSHDGIAERSAAVKAGSELLLLEGLENGDLIELEGKIASSAFVKRTLAEITTACDEYFSRNALSLNVGKEEVRKKLSTRPERKVFQAILKRSDDILDNGDTLSIKGMRVDLDAAQSAMATRILSLLNESQFSPPDLKSMTLSPKEWQVFEPVFKYLIEAGDIVILDTIAFTSASVEAAKRIITERIVSKGPVGIADIRELLGTSRKYAVPMLEHLDSLGVTRRSGDKRVLA